MTSSKQDRRADVKTAFCLERMFSDKIWHRKLTKWRIQTVKTVKTTTSLLECRQWDEYWLMSWRLGWIPIVKSMVKTNTCFCADDWDKYRLLSWRLRQVLVVEPTIVTSFGIKIADETRQNLAQMTRKKILARIIHYWGGTRSWSIADLNGRVRQNCPRDGIRQRCKPPRLLRNLRP